MTVIPAIMMNYVHVDEWL